MLKKMKKAFEKLEEDLSHVTLMDPRLTDLIHNSQPRGEEDPVEALVRDLTKESNAEELYAAGLFLMLYFREHYVEQ
jgi:hypothetical protein